jgi:imidazolonepropionase-like amidohydrolase
VQAARKAGLPVAGHAPEGINVTELADAGQKSIEHLHELLAASSRRDEEVRTGKPETVTERQMAAAEAYHPATAAALFRKLAAKGTWVTPTLTVHRTIARYPDPLITADPRLRHVPPGLLPAWEQRRGPTGAVDPLGRQRVFERYKDIVRGLHEAGVKLLAGSDVPNPYVYPGSSLHDELALLVECGLTPAEVLRMSTLEAAEYLGLSDTLGTVAEGKIADLVLLDANPLVDIANTRSIAAVIVNGRMHTKRELDEALQRNRSALRATN